MLGLASHHSKYIIIFSDDILPSGLHYRMNLQSGKKEAKLVELNERNDDTSLTYDRDKQKEKSEDKVADSIKKIDDEINLVCFTCFFVVVNLSISWRRSILTM